MKHNLWVSLLAAASLGLWSCSEETFGPNEPTNPDPSISDATAYLGFQLKDTEASSRSTHKEYDDSYERFEWFNKGTKEERAIIDNPESNRVLFFNSDYSFFGSGKLQKPNVSTATSDNVYVARKPENVEGMPAYALVVLNSDATRLDNLDTELAAAGTDAVRTVLNYLNEVDTDNPESLAMSEGYFTMSSTAYQGVEADTISVLTPLPTDSVFYETIEEAIMPEHLTTFYVERLLAKFTLLIQGDERDLTFDNPRPIILDGPNVIKVRVNYAPEDGQNKDEYPAHWKINLVNWGMNGLEKNTFLVKTLAQNPTAFPWGPEDNFYSSWNSPMLFRSYWGLDENYNTGIYPDQYRQALDEQFVNAATTNTIYSADYDPAEGLTKDDYTLIYKPYSAFTDRTANKYSLENTFNTDVLANQDINTQPWLRCGTHIILTAQLLIDEIDTGIDLGRPVVDENGFIQGVADKYFSNGMYWSETALKQQAVATLLTNIYYNKKDVLGGNTYKIPDVLNGGYVDYINQDTMPLNTNIPVLVVDNGVDVPLKHEDLAVNAEKYFEFAPAFIKGGDGWVTLKLKDGYKLKANYIEGFEPKEITEAQLVSYIYRFTNLAKHYKEGRMYYAIPIRHNLDSRNFLQNPVKAVSTGDYGVVRNTWYRMTITEILRPGTPVDDPDQPIIPNPEPDDKSLGVEVEIIPWRTVDITVDQLH
ncbi:MAG: Mfa1 fimbrilin C-terminal domain-containing protein [Paramuribaculum sp.]|nr:Mfa1 fimbrilin C-terminal domain-containing protein [Paramuribaculum sp.]